MSGQHQNVIDAADGTTAPAAEQNRSDLPGDSSGLPNWQFSLRTMFITVTVVAGLLAIMAVVNTLTSVLLVWFVLLVFCHVVANAWGTKSNHRAMPPLDESSPANGGVRTSSRVAIPVAEVPRSHLSHRRALNGWLFLPIPAGAIMGAHAGVNMLYGDWANVPNWKTLVVTCISSAALGGFLAFLVSSFLGVAIFAVFDAQRQTAKR